MSAPAFDSVRSAADALVGRPYADHGRGPFEYNCLGVLLELVRRAAGIVLPDPLTCGEEGVRDLRARFAPLPIGSGLRPLDVIQRRVSPPALRASEPEPSARRHQVPELAVALGDGYVLTAVHGGRVVRLREAEWTVASARAYRLREFSA